MGLGYTNKVTTPLNITFEQHIAALPTASQWPIENFTSNNINAIISSMQEGSAMVVCDESFKNDKGAAAWILEAADMQSYVMGTNHVPGDDAVQSAYRSELADFWGSC